MTPTTYLFKKITLIIVMFCLKKSTRKKSGVFIRSKDNKLFSARVMRRMVLHGNTRHPLRSLFHANCYIFFLI